MFQKDDSKAWIRHMMSGIALLPLFGWFIASCILVTDDPTGYLTVFFYYPMNAILGILFITVALYHGNFEMKYLLKKFVKKDKWKVVFCTLSDYIAIITAISGVLAILQLHLSGIVQL